jgi:uncharacterized protein YjbI with pentapeptide repeats
MSKPRFIDDPAFQALRMGDLAAFERLARERNVLDFTDADLRGTDFRLVDLTRVLLIGAYLKDSDLRGCDMRHLDLSGTSIHNAKIGGAFFPPNIDPTEILLSVQFGTRIRTSQN